MARFKFKLQAVLENRKFLEENAENELALAQSELAKRQKVLEECRNEIKELKRAQKKKLSGGALNVNELVSLLEYSSVLSIRETNLIETIKQAELEVESRKEALIIARQNREALDKIREREHIKWRKSQLKAEQKLLDEMAIGIFRRKDA